MSVGKYCVVFGCPNKGSKTSVFQWNGKKVSFHHFPKRDGSETSKGCYNKWIENINRPNFIPLKGSVVCSIHFANYNFCSGPKKLLSEHAVPTLYMGHATTSILASERTNSSPLTEKIDESSENRQKRKDVSKTSKKRADKGVQCEMGRETYRSQPGVTITVTEIKHGLASDEASLPPLEEATSGNPNDDTAFDVPPVEHDSTAVDPLGNADIEVKVSPLHFMDVDDTNCFLQQSLCTCGECDPTISEPESVCCCESNLLSKVNGHVGKCITLHPNFKDVVLDVHALNIGKHHLIASTASDVEKEVILNDTSNSLSRNIAYKQFIDWVNSWISLGVNTMTTIPSCVAKVVMERFPEFAVNAEYDRFNSV